MFRMLRIREAAKLLGMSDNTFVNMLDENKFDWVYIKRSSNGGKTNYYIHRQRFFDYLTNGHRELVPALEKELESVTKPPTVAKALSIPFSNCTKETGGGGARKRAQV